MTREPAVVYVVDDDVSVREALKNLLRSVGLNVQTYGTAQDFLAATRPDTPGCLVLDVRLPGVSGLDLQRQLVEADVDIPIIFITGHGDIQMSVRAMKAGAAEFLTKPFRDQDLLDAVTQAVERSCVDRRHRQDTAALQKCYETLTAREQAVFERVAQGLLNKQIGSQLNITEATVKLHRGHVMHKMQAESLADLIRMWERLGNARPRRRPTPAP